MPSQLVVVDDSNRQIQYTGQGWHFDKVGDNSTIAGKFGHVYQDTLHSLALGTNGSLSFSFQGTKVMVVFANDWQPATEQMLAGNTYWHCFLDNISISINPTYEFGSILEICGTGKLDDGFHELTINITSGTNQTFWLDGIFYSPSPSLSLESGTVLKIDSIDSRITYDSEWGGVEYIGNMTQRFGSTMSFNFTGIGLSWNGFIPANLPHAPSTGTYSIDGGPQASFSLLGLPPGTNDSWYSQEFFSISGLSAGPHTLQVTYQGNSEQTPLTLSYLYVTLSNASALVTTSSATPSITSQPSVGPKTGQPVGAIAGGVVGGTVFIALMLALLFWYKRRHAQARGDTEPGVTPYSYDTVYAHSGPFIATVMPGLRKGGIVGGGQSVPSSTQSESSFGEGFALIPGLSQEDPGCPPPSYTAGPK